MRCLPMFMMMRFWGSRAAAGRSARTGEKVLLSSSCLATVPHNHPPKARRWPPSMSRTARRASGVGSIGAFSFACCCDLPNDASALHPSPVSRFISLPYFSQAHLIGTAPHAASFNRSRSTFPWEGFRPSPEVARTGPLAAGWPPCFFAAGFLAGADPAADGPIASAAAPVDR
jgi:hypothetical protein